jgi:hypothetical protein
MSGTRQNKLSIGSPKGNRTPVFAVREEGHGLRINGKKQQYQYVWAHRLAPYVPFLCLLIDLLTIILMHRHVVGTLNIKSGEGGEWRNVDALIVGWGSVYRYEIMCP